MLPQRVILGVGLAVLLIISAASISLDIKARSDAAYVAHQLEVINEIADVRLLVRRAESAARGFALNGAANFDKEFIEVRDRIAPAIARLKEELRHRPEQLKRLASTEDAVWQRLGVSAEMMERKKVGDVDGINTMFASAAGRALMRQLNDNLDSIVADEQRLLAIRTTNSQRT